MSTDVTEALRERLESGDIERHKDTPFVNILTLDSGARFGLTIAGDGEAKWAIVIGEELTVFDPTRVVRFVELVEQPRTEFEDRIEKGAAEQGLPAESVLFSVPTVELVGALLERKEPHFTRLALMWLLPSELRSLRAEIAALVDEELLPNQLRELAARLVVPE